MNKEAIFGLAFATLIGAVTAQGTDTCTAPTPVGEGVFAFDSSTATGSLEMDCGNGLAYNQDLFWVYTATVAGEIIFDTEGSTFNTVLAIHSGTDCTATCVADDDNAGVGTLSRVIVPGVSIGDQFVVQVGGVPGAFGTGTLNITLGFDCTTAVDDGFEDNDDCASATVISDGTYTGLLASKTDKDHYALCIADGGTLTADILFTHANGDLDIFLREATAAECGSGAGANMLADGFSSSNNETISWTNTTGADLDVVIEVNAWDDVANAADCNVYDLVIIGSGCDGVGTTFCDPANLNCNGVSTTLSGSFGSGTGSDLHLTATNGPSGEFGYFLMSAGMADPGIVLSRGNFCLIDGSNPFGRYNIIGGTANSVGAFSADGLTFNNLVGTGTSAGNTGFDVPATAPLPGSAALAGGTWSFQLWHRDSCMAAGESNFSNGLTVMFP